MRRGGGVGENRKTGSRRGCEEGREGEKGEGGDEGIGKKGKKGKMKGKREGE